MDTLNGLRLFVSATLCNPAFGGLRRTNRNNRIARKWRKRYGAVIGCRATTVCRIGGEVHMCPHMYEKMKSSIEIRSRP